MRKGEAGKGRRSRIEEVKLEQEGEVPEDRDYEEEQERGSREGTRRESIKEGR